MKLSLRWLNRHVDLAGIEPKPQLDSEATFAPMLKREDGLIDWSMDASAIERRVRGFQPWPHAHTSFKSRRLIIWGARVETLEVQSNPGQILATTGDKLVVATGGSKALQIDQLQLEGSRRMTARDFINGFHPRAGESLG